MSVLGTVAAGVTGFFTGWNPQAMALAYSVGSGVDSVINAPDRVGPRLEDLRVQMSQYGAMVPFEWGTNRHAGTIMWPRILEAVEHREEESAKGGPDNVRFTYTLSCAVLICEGPIAGVRRIWANKKIVYDVSLENEGETRDPAIGSIRFHLGTEDQALDPLIEATDGEGPAYRGYAYVVFEDYDVTDLAGRPPQWEFEVITDGVEDIEPTTTFGEEYVTAGVKFEADMDSNGHLWLHTMMGHAVIDPVTGQPVIDMDASAVPQIHEYDAATGELLWFYNVPLVTEATEPPTNLYPIEGTGICSGGYYFIGRGRPGFATTNQEASPYVHGLAVNIETHAVTDFVDQCSSGQFQNAFYSPSVPVPLIDNNKVYFASKSGGFSEGGVGFMPATVGSDQDQVDPVPIRTGAEPLWNIPGGWHQARPPGSCPAPPGNGFDGVALPLPNWAFKSTLLPNGVAIVQGYNASGGSYLTWASHSPMVVDFDLSPPSRMFSVTLPGSSTTMPPIAWDPVNETLWAFAGADRDTLYAITPDGTLTATGVVMPEVFGQAQSNDVKGLAFDEASGQLRIVRGLGSDSYTALLNPLTGTLSEEMQIANIASAPGKMWTVPNSNRTIFANGFKIYAMPTGPVLDPGAVPLSRIVADICARAGLSEDDIDVTDLIDPVDGYIVPRQMTARAALEPLQQAFYFDAVESDDKVKFIKRGKPTATTLAIEDRAARETGQDVPDALTVTRAFELELPVQCDVTYPDIEADHLIGNQSDRRITKDTRHNLNLQLPVVMTAERAKSVARTILYESWQNQSFKFTTTRKYAHLEPTDIVSLPTASALYRGRITAKREQPNGIIEWEARVDSISVYTQTGEGSVPTPYPPQTIFIPGITELELMDIPLLRDEDDGAGYYVAMGAL